jgi:hypothetical protein
MLLEILLVWIVGIPALAVGAATVLARRRERILRRRTSLGGPTRRGAGRRIRFPVL